MFVRGTVVAGRYRLEHPIGEGGMAKVWRAVQFPLDRPVALKFVEVSGPRSQELTQQFLREARVLAAAKHRNIVDVIDFGLADNQQPYMVMELLEGETLSQRFDAQPTLSVRQIGPIISGVLSGLSAIHEAGIVHRDIKPDNVFLVREHGAIFPKLLDFGVARIVNKAAGVRSAIPTSEGLIVGTPQFMAPEQARGLSDIDKRTDLYSVGVIIYRALTGTLPYDHENIGDLIMLVTLGQHTPFAELRPDLADTVAPLVERAMAKARGARFEDAASMRKAWESAVAQVQNEVEKAHSPAPVSFARISHHVDAGIDRTSTAGRRLRRAGGIVFALFAVAAFAVYVVFYVNRATPKSDVASARNPRKAPEKSAFPATVKATLWGVPPSATLRLDGLVIKPERQAQDQLEIEVPYAHAIRRIEVQRADGPTWQVDHMADKSASYAVVFVENRTASNELTPRHPKIRAAKRTLRVKRPIETAITSKSADIEEAKAPKPAAETAPATPERPTTIFQHLGR